MIVSLSEKMRKMLMLQEAACRLGCSHAELIPADLLSCDQRVVLKCRVNSCGQYGRNLMCPPAVTAGFDWVGAVEGYHFALVLQRTIVVPDNRYREIYDHEKPAFLKLVLDLEKEAFRAGFSLAYGLTAGHCDICRKCVGVDHLACLHPEQARPSMEAIGINVEYVTHAAGVLSGFIDGEVTLTGLLLID